MAVQCLNETELAKHLEPTIYEDLYRFAEWLDQGRIFPEDFKDMTPQVIRRYCGYHYGFPMHKERSSTSVYELLEEHAEPLYRMHQFFAKHKMDDWLVFHAAPGRWVTSKGSDREYDEMLRATYRRLGVTKETRGFRIVGCGVLELMMLFYVYPWKCRYMDVCFYNVNRDVLIEFNHHVSMFIYGKNTKLLHELGGGIEGSAGL